MMSNKEQYSDRNKAGTIILPRPDDPYIYLYVMNEWYCYKPTDPPLGSGAMGIVYKGYRCQNGEWIAVKRVKDEYANNKMIRERAKQEASLAFRHDHLIEMIGYCEWQPETGPIFILSKFVKGSTIEEYIKTNMFEGTDKVEKICELIYPILDALDYVHSGGVIHRDIKPSNIMVEQEHNVRLMDLGIARMNEGNAFSAFGFIGTPQYAAPEQIIRSKDCPISAATDIYELGITFYELLTGSNPFDCEVEADTLSKQMKEPLPPSKKIPRRLMQVIWKATEKEQSKRYQTALEFKKAIKAAMEAPRHISDIIREYFNKNVVFICCIMTALLIILLLFILN